jgi:hypothetical protein
MQSLLIRLHCSTPTTSTPSTGKTPEKDKKKETVCSYFIYLFILFYFLLIFIFIIYLFIFEIMNQWQSPFFSHVQASYKLRAHLDPTIVQWLLGFVLDFFYIILTRPTQDLNDFLQGGTGKKKDPKRARMHVLLYNFFSLLFYFVFFPFPFEFGLISVLFLVLR